MSCIETAQTEGYIPDSDSPFPSLHNRRRFKRNRLETGTMDSCKCKKSDILLIIVSIILTLFTNSCKTQMITSQPEIWHDHNHRVCIILSF